MTLRLKYDFITTTCSGPKTQHTKNVYILIINTVKCIPMVDIKHLTTIYKLPQFIYL